MRFLDRFFDHYVMTNMMKLVGNAMRPEGKKDDFGVAQARADLNTAYDWIEAQLGDGWAVGDQFTLADCAAAPSLFYADWAEPIDAARPRLVAYRARLLAHPPVARAVNEARPYRPFFPLGAPDRDSSRIHVSDWFNLNRSRSRSCSPGRPRRAIARACRAGRPVAIA